MDVIIYKDVEGHIAIITPSPEFLNRWGIDAVAKKDVPPGRPYKIIDSSEIPEDRSGWVVAEFEASE